MSKSLEITGTLFKKFETEQISDKFQKREFVVSIEDGPYTEYVKFELIGDRCDLLEPFSENEQVKVAFNLKGREWQGKYFVNLRAWRITKNVEPLKVEKSSNTDQSDSLPF